jgi:hypothetical protein
MTYHAILFMCNDEHRADFVLENFIKHNPEIGVTVYNGGKNTDLIKTKYPTVEYIKGPNLWHKGTRHAPGSFSYGWFEMLFSTYKRKQPDYLIFLETDVKTNKKIEIEPKYDVAGPIISCGYMEQLVMYDFWGNYLDDKPFTEDRSTTWSHKYHTGVGGTVLSKNFFEKCESNLHKVKQCYETIPLNCYADVLLSCFARHSGCTLGDWEEATDTRGAMRLIGDRWSFEGMNDNCALVHNFKV